MNLEKAIQILQMKVEQNVFQVDPDAFDALKLGIEALRRFQSAREVKFNFYALPLPGETKD